MPEIKNHPDDRLTDEYRTIRGEHRAETKVQGSRFIATASPVSAKDAAEALVELVRKEFHNATHNCFAYRIGARGGLFRFHDDGEPSSTAGKPILAAIDKAGMTDVVVVVTRYFGGTKLGTGGLIRAYGNAAEEVLQSAGVVLKYQTESVRASFPHSEISHVMHAIVKHGARIVATEYDEEVHVIVEIRRSKLEELKGAVINASRGNVRLSCSPEAGSC